MHEHLQPDAKPVTTQAVPQPAEPPDACPTQPISEENSGQAVAPSELKLYPLGAPTDQPATEEPVDETEEWEEEGRAHFAGEIE